MTDILINSRTNAVLESLGENTRWLVENSAVTQRAYAEMVAERGASPVGDRAGAGEPR